MMKIRLVEDQILEIKNHERKSPLSLPSHLRKLLHSISKKECIQFVDSKGRVVGLAVVIPLAQNH